VDEIARAIDRDADEIIPRPPVTDARRGVIDGCGSLTRDAQRLLIRQIAFDEFDVLGLEPGAVRAAAKQDTDWPAATTEVLDHVAAQQAGSAGDEIHRNEPSAVSDQRS